MKEDFPNGENRRAAMFVDEDCVVSIYVVLTEMTSGHVTVWRE